MTLSVGVVVVNRSVCGPRPSMLRLENLATPFEAVAVTLPSSLPLPLAMDAVTTSMAPLPVVTTKPALSRMRTTGCVVNTSSSAAPAGWV